MKGGKSNSEIVIDSLCDLALAKGADKAVAIQASDVVIDERVRMKCLVPTCSFYGNNLLCPPNLMAVEEFRKIVDQYSTAVLIRLPSSSKPVPPEISGVISLNDLWRKIDPRKNSRKKDINPAIDYFGDLKASQEKLYKIIESMEAGSLAAGHRFATGFAAGGCLLCDRCVGPKSNEPCRHPFRARPSMEAMGIDVVGTAEKAGLQVDFSDDQPHWFGLVLIE